MSVKQDLFQPDIRSLINKISMKDFIPNNQEFDIHLKVNEDLFTFEENFESIKNLFLDQNSFDDIEYITIFHKNKGIITIDLESESLIMKGDSLGLEKILKSLLNLDKENKNDE